MTAPAPLTRGWKRAIAVVVGLGGALALIGFGNSFAAVADAVSGSFDWPWTVPLGIDVAIAVLTGADIIQARLNMRTRWLRFIPWGLVGATIYLNVATETTWVGWVAHTALPALWVVAVEIAAHTIRVLADLASAERREGIRWARWVLAPLATPVMWRRMVLWDVRAYADGQAREEDRLLVLACLRQAYGRWWRRKAPPGVRVMYRLGKLTATPHVEGGGSAVRLELGFRDVGTRGTAVPPVPPAIPPPPPTGPAPTAATGRELLAVLYDAHPHAGTTTDTELAAEWFKDVGFSFETTRKYLGEIRKSRSSGSNGMASSSAGGGA